MNAGTAVRTFILCMGYALFFNCVLAGPIYITDFGARPDATDNGRAIQSALDEASRQGGGTVVVPPGVFSSGPLKVTRGIHLQLEAGAVLQAYPEAIQARYPKGTGVFLDVTGVSHLRISGPGAIRGTGQDTLAVSRFHPFSAPPFRYHLIIISQSNSVFIENLRILESEMFALIIDHCENVFLNGVVVRNNFFHQNTDGIDIGECRNVHISNTHVTAGDDAICFKNGSENVTITNCTLETASSAIKFGTSTAGRFANIRVSNCIIYNSMVGVGMFMKDGGIIENCHFSHLTISNIADTLSVNHGLANQQVPIYIDLDLRDSTSKPGVIRDVTFESIDIHSIHPVLIQGMKAQPIERLTLRNVSFNVTGGYDLRLRNKPLGFANSKFYYHSDHRLNEFARKNAYLTFANVSGLTLENIRVTVPDTVQAAFPRPAIHAEGITTAHVSDISFTRAEGVQVPVIQAVRINNLKVKGPVEGKFGEFIRLSQSPKGAVQKLK